MLDAIDRRGSFAAAGVELDRVPSAITYTVRRLEDDLDVLDAFGQAPPKHRLACCAKLKSGGGTVRVQAVDE